MTRKKRQGSKNDKVRKISRTGVYTYYVTIPKRHIDDLEWDEGQNVIVELEGDTLTIKRWKQKGRAAKKT